MPSQDPNVLGGTVSSLQSAARADSPVQLDNTVPITEWKNSREISIDYQKGVSYHVYDVPGNPAEAILDARLSGVQSGGIHPFSGKAAFNGFFDHYYLEKQSFQHLIRDSNPAERLSRVTCIYEQGPCPGAYSQTLRVVTRPILEWYPRSPHPDLGWVTMTGSAQATPIPAPRIVLIRRYRRLRTTLDDLISLARQVGKLGRPEETIGGTNGSAWMFEGLEARMLYGDFMSDSTPHEYAESTWEVTLYLEGDFTRRHAIWFPKFDAYGMPVTDPTGQANREDLHEIWSFFETLPSSRPINNLIDTSRTDAFCPTPTDNE